MGTGLSYLTARTAVLLPLVAALSACAMMRPVSTAPGTAGREAVAERGPRVRIWTTDEFGTGPRVRAAFRLDDDAYVAVVNVGLDGYASVIFPESPTDDGFMRGGRTYRLPSFFPGFANHFHASRYGRLYNAATAYGGFYDRYAGYVFIIASWRPMDFGAVDELGLWDHYRLAAHERQLEPYEVIHQFAQRLVPGRARDYSAHFARYAAFSVGPGRQGSLASCLVYGSTLGYVPWWTSRAARSRWAPAYGFGYYGVGSRCGYGYDARLVGYRARRTLVTPPVRPPTRPVRPVPPTSPDDSAAAPTRPRRPRRPVVASDSGAGTPRDRRHLAEEETIIDVTRETRDLARRRDPDADRIDRALRRGYGVPDDRTRSARARTTERADERSEVDRRQPRRRPAVDHDARARGESSRGERARGESARGDQRASEPRREPPPRPIEEQPRQPARPQPAPRSEPAPRPEPRAERAARPIEHR